MVGRLIALFALITLTACSDIEVAGGDDTGALQICIPLAARCTDDASQVEVCRSDGTAFLFAEDCASDEPCDAATCVPSAGGSGTCVNDSLRCAPDESAVQKCQAGSWIVEEDCMGHGCADWTCK